MIMLSDIQTRLTKAIRESGVKQVELARQLNISQSSIAHYLKGDIMPALDTFANLCAVLDLDPAEILCLNEYKPPVQGGKVVTVTNSFNNSNNIDFKA